MSLRSSDVPHLAVVICWVGGTILVLGSLLLTFEGPQFAGGGLDIGALGANFVVLGTIIAASGFWILQPHYTVRAGWWVAGLLVTFGLGCLTLSAYSEPVLTRTVAGAALITGIRGAAHHLSSITPHLRYSGEMPLGEIAAMVSLLANGIIVCFLFYKSRALGLDDPASFSAVIAWTALFVGAVLVVESFVLRFMRKDNESEMLEDERDQLIREEAAHFAHVLLISIVVLVVVQLALGGALDFAGSPNAALGLSSSVAIAHTLLGLLFVSECGRRIAELWLYRRARR